MVWLTASISFVVSLSSMSWEHAMWNATKANSDIRPLGLGEGQVEQPTQARADRTPLGHDAQHDQ